MIFICHYDPARPDCKKQAELCRTTFHDVKQSGSFVMLPRGYSSSEYKKYNLDTNYPVYNRHIAILDYIEQNKIYDQPICILDPDMFFRKSFELPVLNSNDFYGTEWCRTNQEDLDIVCSTLDRNGYSRNSSFFGFAAPYFSTGSNICELSRLILKLDSQTREVMKTSKNLWVSEMYTQSYVVGALNLNVMYSELSNYCYWKNNTLRYMENLSIFHYPWDARGSGGLIKKHNIHNKPLMQEHIKKFGEPADAYSSVLFDFYKRYF